MTDRSFSDLDTFKTDVLKDWMHRNMSSHTFTCCSSPTQSSTTSSDNNACQHQCNYQQQLPSSLSSLESFLFLPQLPVDGDDVGENVWLYPNHHHYLRQQNQQQKPSQKQHQQRFLSSSLLSIVNPKTKSSSEITSRKTTMGSSFTDHLNKNDDHTMLSCNKECNTGKPASTLSSLSERCVHDFQQSCKSTCCCNHVCGSKPTNSLFPFIATNDTVIAAASSNNSNNDYESSAATDVDVVLNNKSQHQRLSSSMSILIKNNSSDNNSSHNHPNTSSLYLAANHHHHRQEKHSHQHHTPLSHYRHFIRRRLFILRICQAFSILLCVLFLFNLVKNSTWASDYEQKRIIDPLSVSPSLTSPLPVSSRLHNRLVQSWNMPSIISSSALLSSSSHTFEISEILSVSSIRSHNDEHDGTDDDSNIHNLMLLDVPNFRFLMNNKTKCNIPRDDDNYFDGGGGGNDEGTTSTNNYGKRADKNTSTIFFMIIVHSAPRNFEERQAIRDTWGSLQRLGQFHIRLVFLLGHEMNPDDDHDGNNSNKNNNNISSNNVVADVKGDKMSTSSSSDSTNHNTFFSKIQRESQVHGDIVTGNFHDSYRNLTYKHLMGYIWVLNYCSHAKYILKEDDDAFIDLFQLFEFLLRTFGKDPEPALICNVFPDGTKPVRDSDELGKKWAVTYEEYPDNFYPKYCGGLAYLATPNVIREIYRMSRVSKNKFLWIDDVYVTGILRELAHVEPFYLNLRYSYDPEEYKKWLTSSSTNKMNNLKHDDPISYVNFNKQIINDRKIRVAMAASPGLSNQINNDRRAFPPQKIPFMIVHMERGSQLAREMRDLWNKTVTVWSESGGIGLNDNLVHLKNNKGVYLKI